MVDKTVSRIPTKLAEMKYLSLCVYWACMSIVTSCTNPAEPSPADAAKSMIRLSPSILVTLHGSLDGEIEKLISNRECIENVDKAIVPSVSSWSHRQELVPMLTGAWLWIRPANGDAEIFIVAPDAIVCTSDRRTYSYGETKPGLWNEIWEIVKNEPTSKPKVLAAPTDLRK